MAAKRTIPKQQRMGRETMCPNEYSWCGLDMAVDSSRYRRTLNVITPGGCADRADRRRRVLNRRADTETLRVARPDSAFGTPLAAGLLKQRFTTVRITPADAVRHKATPGALADRNRRKAERMQWASTKSTTRSIRTRSAAMIAKFYRDRSRRWPKPKHISLSRT